jgi:hypothetical protein
VATGWAWIFGEGVYAGNDTIEDSVRQRSKIAFSNPLNRISYTRSVLHKVGKLAKFERPFPHFLERLEVLRILRALEQLAILLNTENDGGRPSSTHYDFGVPSFSPCFHGFHLACLDDNIIPKKSLQMDAVTRDSRRLLKDKGKGIKDKNKKT